MGSITRLGGDASSESITTTEVSDFSDRLPIVRLRETISATRSYRRVYRGSPQYKNIQIKSNGEKDNIPGLFFKVADFLPLVGDKTAREGLRIGLGLLISSGQKSSSLSWNSSSLSSLSMSSSSELSSFSSSSAKAYLTGRALR